MRTDYDERICYHINVPDVQPDGSAALFEFMCKHVDKNHPEPVETSVKVWFPRVVLESWSTIMPKLLSDLVDFEREAKANAPKPS